MWCGQVIIPTIPKCELKCCIAPCSWLVVQMQCAYVKRLAPHKIQSDRRWERRRQTAESLIWSDIQCGLIYSSNLTGSSHAVSVRNLWERVKLPAIPCRNSGPVQHIMLYYSSLLIEDFETSISPEHYFCLLHFFHMHKELLFVNLHMPFLICTNIAL